MSNVRKKDRKTHRFTTLDKAADVYNHTLLILENEKIFGTKYQRLQERLVNSAAMIYHCCRTANDDCDANTKDGAMERLKLQAAAIGHCKWTKTYIKLSKRAFHLRASKVTYWNDLVNEAMKYIKAWNQAETKRFKDIYGL